MVLWEKKQKIGGVMRKEEDRENCNRLYLDAFCVIEGLPMTKWNIIRDVAMFDGMGSKNTALLRPRKETKDRRKGFK